jgi:16S rRNA (guanine1516-N2)-methyltransferase
VIELGVTVSTYRFASEARARAHEWGLPFLERPERGGLTALLQTDARALLVLCGTGWRLKDRQGECGFGPGMAAVRIKRLRTGVQQPDALVLLGELRAGDVVVDATLGAGADALVCAHVVGRTGRVIGFEASRPLFLLASQALPTLQVSPAACIVEPYFGDARVLLAKLPARSADCVMFDAMFDRQKGSTPSFDVLRRFALHAPLTRETIELARVVARRWVVIKAATFGGELKRLGLQAAPRTRFGPLEWARVSPLP